MGVSIAVEVTAVGGAYRAVFGSMSVSVMPETDIQCAVPVQDASAYLMVVQPPQKRLEILA